MDHAAQVPSGALPDWLPPGDGPLSVPELVGLGCALQYGPLHGLGLSPEDTGVGTCALP